MLVCQKFLHTDTSISKKLKAFLFFCKMFWFFFFPQILSIKIYLKAFYHTQRTSVKFASCKYNTPMAIRAFKKRICIIWNWRPRSARTNSQILNFLLEAASTMTFFVSLGQLKKNSTQYYYSIIRQNHL